jgi:hypothetical protein
MNNISLLIAYFSYSYELYLFSTITAAAGFFDQRAF